MLGFTKSEERVLAVLIGAFVLGSAIRMYQSRLAPLPETLVKAQWIPDLETETDPDLK